MERGHAVLQNARQLIAACSCRQLLLIKALSSAEPSPRLNAPPYLSLIRLSDILRCIIHSDQKKNKKNPNNSTDLTLKGEEYMCIYWE